MGVWSDSIPSFFLPVLALLTVYGDFSGREFPAGGGWASELAGALVRHLLSPGREKDPTAHAPDRVLRAGLHWRAGLFLGPERFPIRNSPGVGVFGPIGGYSVLDTDSGGVVRFSQ
jgi:hypothetical protein